MGETVSSPVVGSSEAKPRIRIGVVGAGEIAQTTHLPYLEELSAKFELTALTDPSAHTREFLERRYRLERSYADYEAMLEHPGLQAVVVCSPNSTHAAAILAALEAGKHVFVEKPLCITLADADRVIAARDRAGLVVQVGYMNRYDVSYECMLSDLPTSSRKLRGVNVLTYDPRLGRFFHRYDMSHSRDVPQVVIDATKAAEAAQVEEAVGRGDPEACYVFSEIFLGTLVHDVNLVHGLLERMGEPLPAEVVDGACWADGKAASGALRLQNGARWSTTFLELPGIHDFRQTVQLFMPDAIHTLAFPSPYLRQAPSIYELSTEANGARLAKRVGSYEECFARELLQFHACVIDGAPCPTPPEQARLDIEVLTEMYVLAQERTAEPFAATR